MQMRRVPVTKLRPGMVLSNDIFSEKNSVVPLLTKNTVITEAVIRQILSHDIPHVLISNTYNLKHIDIPKPPPVIAPALAEEAVENVATIMSITRLDQADIHAASAQVVKQLDSVVERLVDSVLKDETALVNITDLKSYDEYTYHHSLSVAVLSIAIGQSLGFPTQRLNHLGKCAMMHDIGKTAVPIEIINKPGRLDFEEFEVIKTHSRASVDYLKKANIGDEAMWAGVLGHHEKMDGSGYPEGLVGEQIPLLSRIISIADVYDALTSNRSYRSPMQPFEAVEYIMGNVGAFFDFDIVRAFMEKLELYPVGSFVELSDNRIAVVKNNINTLRPVVQVLDTGDVLDMFMDRRCLSLTIKQALPDHFVAV